MKSMPPKKILIVAGEASSDLHGSNLVRALKEKCRSKKMPCLKVIGLGGPRMQAAGVELLYDLTRLASAGLDPLRNFNKFTQIFRQVVSNARQEKPDLAVLIDFPDFNLRLAAKLKEQNIPIIYYISPQIWAWRPGRIKTIARLIDKMLVIFEFEEKLYQKHKIPVEFVGHPLLDVIRTEVRRQKSEVRKQLRLKKDDFVMGLLPGSRETEIKRHLPVMLESARLIKKDWHKKQMVFSIAAAPKISPALIKRLTSNFNLPCKIYYNQSYDVIQASDLVITSSGTATIEAAIFGTPMIVIYKVSLLTALAFSPLIKTSFYAMANIIAGKKVVPELIQRQARPEKIAAAVLQILQQDQLPQISRELDTVRRRLGSAGASTRAATAILNFLAFRDF